MMFKSLVIKAAANAATDVVRKAYWVYDNPSEFLRIFMWHTAVAFSLLTARALLILTGAALMGAIIFVMMKTTGFNIDHTVFVLLPCFIVAHLIGHFTDIYCNISWAVWSPAINRLREKQGVS
jgi:hypothetical protein